MQGPVPAARVIDKACPADRWCGQATAYFPPEARTELAAVVRWATCLPYLLQAHLSGQTTMPPEVSAAAGPCLHLRMACLNSGGWQHCSNNNNPHGHCDMLPATASSHHGCCHAVAAAVHAEEGNARPPKCVPCPGQWFSSAMPAGMVMTCDAQGACRPPEMHKPDGLLCGSTCCHTSWTGWAKPSSRACGLQRCV